jgi:predicted lipid-binding transport protein (Tim44 family)
MFGGGSFGGAMAGILMVLAVVAAGFMLFRFLAARGSAAPSPRPMQFAGIGGDAAPRQPVVIGSAIASSAQAPAGPAASLPPGFETEPFLRVAKTSFIRLQAANDAGDLDDIRDYTTPEMFAELSMQVGERGGAQQKTEVVSVDAKLVEAVVEGDYEIASVRFSGLIREAPEANPEPFDEIWHVRKKANDRKATWLIAGIQQAA